jgi:hypothetical protein
MTSISKINGGITPASCGGWVSASPSGCRNVVSATWTEMTSRMNDLLNSVTECHGFDKDDTLDPRNTNISRGDGSPLGGSHCGGPKNSHRHREIIGGDCQGEK